MSTIFTLFSALVLLSPGLDAESPIMKKLESALDTDTVNPERELDCMLYRMEEEIKRAEKKVARLEKELVALTKPRPKGEQCAFTTYLSSSSSGLYSSGGRIRFTKVVTNVGGAYSVGNGIFTSPADGVYVFHFHTNLYYYNKHCALSLYRSGIVVTTAYGYEGSVGYNSFGGTAVLELKKSETVYIGITSPLTRSSCPLRGPFTTFTGYRI
ncbi:complement C1q-like protein 4 [Ylistrum balloti]|uniref:complement C1q-like protein 4 n=1 Tax=Ylistrum balloti TaxID=509963 RepID=UPI0029059233|nr:complement C1q-like protein 4 [Ylistrum balloti]